MNDPIILVDSQTVAKRLNVGVVTVDGAALVKGGGLSFLWVTETP